jgi:hypothetical protein
MGEREAEGGSGRMTQPAARLFWKGRHVGDVTQIVWLDFPWRIGVLRPLLRDGSLEWALRRATLVAQTDEDDWVDEMFEGDVTGTWWIDEPDGERRYIFAPIYDERDSTICWR